MTATVSRRDTGRIVFVVPLVTFALGVLAAGAIWSRESDQAGQRDLQAATQVATELGQAASSTVDGLRGASAMVADDREVSGPELAAFADSMARRSDLRTVAHVVLVPDADRAAYEQEHGFEISEIGPDGTLVRAAPRAEYAAVTAVEWDDPSIIPSYGLDLRADPLRAEALAAAEDSGLPSLSPPLSFTRTGRLGYMSVVTLTRPDGEVVGYLTGSFAVDDVVAAAREHVDASTEIAVFDDGVRIAGDLEDGARAQLDVGGRTLDVRADEGTPVNLWPALAVAVGAVLASVALTLAIRGLRRSERAASLLAEHLDTERAQAMRLADLGRELTAVGTRAEVITLLETALPDVTAADETTVAFVDGALLRPTAGPGLVPLETHLPVTEAVHDRRVVTVDDVEAYQHAHSDLLADAKARHIRSVAAVPLIAADGASFGVISLVWHERRTFSPADEVGLTTLGALVSGTVQRVDATADAVRHADAHARLAEELALATTIDQVVSASASHLPSISDAADVRLARTGDATDGGERHVLTDTSGDAVGELLVAWPTASGPDVGQQARLQTAIGLIDETVRRVDIQRSTSEALLSLRKRLLRPLPSPVGLDLAARYRPTSRPLGMGGDWYDVIERGDGTVGIVIGDVVGHGIPAIATMIHVSTILGGLVRSRTPVDEIIGRAGDMLDADGMIATAQVLLIDPAGGELTMVSAGHPPPLLRLPGGDVERLPEATHAPLGVGDGAGQAVHVAFPPGGCVLSYTDGLVERRDEPIDAGISRLAEVFATTNGSVWGAVSDVLRAMAPDGDDRVGDDVAIVVAQRRQHR